MRLDDLIAGLAARYRLPAPAAEPDGGFTLSIDRRYEVRFLPMGSDRAVLTAMLADLPDNPRRRNEMLTWLMRLNLAYLKRSASVLSVDDQAGQVALHRILPLAETDQSDFDASLRDFLNDVDFWSESREEQARPAPSPVMIFP